MSLALAGMAGLGSFAGSIVRGISSGGSDIDGRWVGSVIQDPSKSAAAQAGAEGAARIAGVQSDPLADALARQEYMRQQQMRNMALTHDIAMGGRSLVREQAAQEQMRLRNAIQGQAASARGSYGQLAGSRAAPMQSSLIGARMVAPTNAAAMQEQQQAMDQYAAALSGQGQGDAAEYMNYLQQRRNAAQGLLSGEQIQQYGAGQSTKSQGIEGMERLNQQQYPG